MLIEAQPACHCILLEILLVVFVFQRLSTLLKVRLREIIFKDFIFILWNKMDIILRLSQFSAASYAAINSGASLDLLEVG
jgi:hypothetical protein